MRLAASAADYFGHPALRPFGVSLRLLKIAPGDFVCPSCGARRMAETAALLADEVLPALPLRQWVISFPFALRFLYASRPEALARALELIYRNRPVTTVWTVRDAGVRASG